MMSPGGTEAAASTASNLATTDQSRNDGRRNSITGPAHYAEAEARHRQAEISMLRADLEPEERARLADYALRSATVHALLAAAAAAAFSGSMPRADDQAWRAAAGTPLNTDF
jgi:hypothetical protein